MYWILLYTSVYITTASLLFSLHLELKLKCFSFFRLHHHRRGQTLAKMSENFRAALPRCDFRRPWSAIFRSPNEWRCCSSHVSEPQERWGFTSKCRGSTSRPGTFTRRSASCLKGTWPRWYRVRSLQLPSTHRTEFPAMKVNWFAWRETFEPRKITTFSTYFDVG